MPHTDWRRSAWLALCLGSSLPMSRAWAAQDGPQAPPMPDRTHVEAPPDDLAGRVQRLEEMNRRLLEQYNAVLSREAERDQRYQELERRYQGLLDRLDEPTDAQVSPAEASVLRSAEEPDPFAEPAEEDSLDRVIVGPGRAFPIFAPGTEPGLLGKVGEGFELFTPDEELSLGVRVLNQVDFKAFAPGDLDPATSGLYLPRTRFYLAGHLTKPIEYEVSFQRSLEGVLDLLDGFVNFRFDEGFQIKFGRSLVPYSFDWYDHLEPYFITPERSLYPLNFGLSRQAGLMGWGYLRDGRLEYAVGGFSGGMLGIADINATREAVGYLNWRPFLTSEQFPRLRYLNLGGSIAGGLTVRHDAERPMPLRTSIQATENSREASAASINFLDFEEDVRSFGERFQGALHMAYYGGGWSFESEVQAGRYQYEKLGSSLRPTVPVVGYHVTAARFLTGETPHGRTTIVPLRPFSPSRGLYGPGALEVFARVSQLRLGSEVFEYDLADENLWTREVVMTDIGFNWYANRYLKFYFDWQRSAFGSPVLLNERDGTLRRSSDLFWIRCQIWF
ncbi:porin [Tautonia sp. JC769]|uniref:OprO/OprP family phosphate-selective porin n=1 Tax=Tautonia sp. JC769 TaxID=3232135 RepID=UPI0034587026